MFSEGSSWCLQNISSDPLGSRAVLGATADWQLCLEVICDLGCAETASLSQLCLHYHSFVRGPALTPGPHLKDTT